jgi:hypothetical protein
MTRRQGKPTRTVTAKVKENIELGKPGVKFEVWDKTKRKDTKMGTLIVSVGGLRWRAANGKLFTPVPWTDAIAWLESK